jgi:hypothetical protein
MKPPVLIVLLTVTRSYRINSETQALDDVEIYITAEKYE